MVALGSGAYAVGVIEHDGQPALAMWPVKGGARAIGEPVDPADYAADDAAVIMTFSHKAAVEVVERQLQRIWADRLTGWTYVLRASVDEASEPQPHDPQVPGEGSWDDPKAKA